MITAVDTNVAIDVLRAPPAFGRLALDAVRRCAQQGSLIVCEAVWSEVRAGYDDERRFELAMDALGISFVPMAAASAALAGATFRAYRRRGGTRERIMADFLIGAHALGHADRLLTRDASFFERNFPALTLIDSSAT